MESKKSLRHNLESKRGMFLQIGMVVSLLITLMAFEYQSRATVNEFASWDTIDKYEPVIDNTFRKDPEIKKPIIEKIKTSEIVAIDNNKVETGKIESVETNETDTVTVLIGHADEVAEIDSVLIIAGTMPGFMGGDAGIFRNYIQKELNYPAEARDNNISGNVYVRFVIDEKGKLIRPEILKSDHPDFANEVLRALDKSPEWSPGEQNYKKVKVGISMRFVFVMN